MDRNERIKAHGMNPDKVWYHGTGHDIKSFSHEFVGKGNDALGSGFYFTENPHVASGYAGGAEHDLQKKEMDNSNVAPNVLPVHLKLTKAVSHTKPLTRVQIGKIIKSAPNYKDSLYNFGDIDYEGEHRVLNDAVNSYKDLPSDRDLSSQQAEPMRQILFKKGLAASSYGTANIDELWATTVEHAALQKNVPPVLKKLIYKTINGW